MRHPVEQERRQRPAKSCTPPLGGAPRRPSWLQAPSSAPAWTPSSGSPSTTPCWHLPGIRCDIAEVVLHAFWTHMVASVLCTQTKPAQSPADACLVSGAALLEWPAAAIACFKATCLHLPCAHRPTQLWPEHHAQHGPLMSQGGLFRSVRDDFVAASAMGLPSAHFCHPHTQCHLSQPHFFQRLHFAPKS